jgi:hypothetical protein
MTFKRFALAFCIVCPIIISSCKIEDISLTYTFDNQSSFAVQITLSKPYKYKTSSEKSSETETFTSPFSVSSLDATKVSIQSDGNVNFQWTTDSGGDNAKISCVTNGQKATFKDRYKEK